MMIGVIIDLIASKEVTTQRRRMLDKKIRRLLQGVFERFENQCIARPSLTQGDSIELLVDNWLPIIFLFHRLLLEGLKFQAGIGTGKIIIKNENADDCDGPVFWNAREAITKIKRAKYMKSAAGFKLARRTSAKETSAVTNSILFLAVLLSLSPTQLRHCYYYLWEENQISRIAKRVKTSKSNVSKTLSKTPCFLLRKVIAFSETISNK